MKILDMKKGIITHPVPMFIFALILGLVLAYVWINYIDIANPYCNIPSPP